MKSRQPANIDSLDVKQDRHSTISEIQALLTYAADEDLSSIRDRLMHRKNFQSNLTTSRLLQLPRELRDMIIGYALNSSDFRYLSVKRIRFPALMAVSQQLRAETAERLYAMAPLKLYIPFDNDGWTVEELNIIDPKHRQFVRKLWLENPNCFRKEHAVDFAAEVDGVYEFRQGTTYVVSSTSFSFDKFNKGLNAEGKEQFGASEWLAQECYVHRTELDEKTGTESFVGFGLKW